MRADFILMAVIPLLDAAGLNQSSPQERRALLPLQGEVFTTIAVPRRSTPSDPAMHPSFLGLLADGPAGAYTRGAMLRGGWDAVAMVPVGSAGPGSIEWILSNDWDPQRHGPTSPPGDCRNGIIGSEIEAFPGVFDRDLLFRDHIDRAPVIVARPDSESP